MTLNNANILPVSVIIPTLNCREKLSAHLDASEEWLPYVQEVIAIDSQSTDGTYEILEERLKKYNAVIIKAEKGLYQCWNQAISQSSKSFIYISTIGDTITKCELEELYLTATQNNLELVIGTPLIVDSKGQTIQNIKWPIHWLKEHAPKVNLKILEEKERIFLASAFMPESIIGSSASNLYRRDVLVNCPFPISCGHQGDVAWAISNIPKIKTGFIFNYIGKFCWDGSRRNTWKKNYEIFESLSHTFHSPEQHHFNGNQFLAIGFLCWLHNSNAKKYRSLAFQEKRLIMLEKLLSSFLIFKENLIQTLNIPKNFRYFSKFMDPFFGKYKIKSYNSLTVVRVSSANKISIVTPSLNQCGFIPEMLNSLQSQDHPDWEHVVFDAGSMDGSVEVWREWEERGKLKNGETQKLSTGEIEACRNAETETLRNGERLVRVFVEADRGQSDAINKGMRVATGEIVGWLNADDVLLPGALAKVAEAFKKNPDAVVVYGVGAKTDLEGREIKRVPFRKFVSLRLKKAWELIQPAMFFRRDAYWKVGGLDESLHYAMDWDLLLKLAKIGNVVAIPDHLANIRYYPETKTNTGGWQRMREIARIARSHNGALDRNFLSFQIRECLAKRPMRLPRRLFDHICWNLFKDPPLMVQGWPEEKMQN